MSCPLGGYFVSCPRTRPETSSVAVARRTLRAVTSSACLSLHRPGDFFSAAQRKIRNVTGAGGGDAGFHRRVWFFAGAYAVEEIFHVADGAVAETFAL